MQESTRTRGVIGLLVLSPQIACSRSDQLAFYSISRHIKIAPGYLGGQEGFSLFQTTMSYPSTGVVSGDNEI